MKTAIESFLNGLSDLLENLFSGLVKPKSAVAAPSKSSSLSAAILPDKAFISDQNLDNAVGVLVATQHGGGGTELNFRLKMQQTAEDVLGTEYDNYEKLRSI